MPFVPLALALLLILLGSHPPAPAFLVLSFGISLFQCLSTSPVESWHLSHNASQVTLCVRTLWTLSLPLRNQTPILRAAVRVFLRTSPSTSASRLLSSPAQLLFLHTLSRFRLHLLSLYLVLESSPLNYSRISLPFHLSCRLREQLHEMLQILLLSLTTSLLRHSTTPEEERA